MPNHFQPGQSDPRRGFLQTGAAPLDDLLRSSGVPRGGAIHLDFAGGQPDTFLLGVCQTVLLHGARAVFLYVPTFVHLDEDEEKNADVRAGRKLTPEFARGLKTFGLAPFFNAQDPADPASPLRYLVANTFIEFEEVLDSLLSDPAGAPDHVFVYGLEQLFQNTRLFYWMPEEDDALYLVQAESARLRVWLQEAAPHLEDAGTALWLARSSDSYEVGVGTLFTRGLRPLLQANCAATLLVEKTLTCNDCSEALPGIGGVPITLYRRDVLLGETFVEVLLGEGNNKGFDGPFVDSNPDVADFLETLG